MPRVVVFDEFGGPEVMHVVEEPVLEPTAGEVRVRIEAFAVNPLDQMMRSGTSPGPVPLPHARLGVEGTGVIDALGPEVTGLEIGDPVILTAIPDASVRGSYAEYTTVPARRVIARPAGLGTGGPSGSGPRSARCEGGWRERQWRVWPAPGRSGGAGTSPRSQRMSPRSVSAATKPGEPPRQWPGPTDPQ